MESVDLLVARARTETHPRHFVDSWKSRLHNIESSQRILFSTLIWKQDSFHLNAITLKTSILIKPKECTFLLIFNWRKHGNIVKNHWKPNGITFDEISTFIIAVLTLWRSICLSQNKFQLEPLRLHIFNEKISLECRTFWHLFNRLQKRRRFSIRLNFFFFFCNYVTWFLHQLWTDFDDFFLHWVQYSFRLVPY